MLRRNAQVVRRTWNLSSCSSREIGLDLKKHAVTRDTNKPSHIILERAWKQVIGPTSQALEPYVDLLLKFLLKVNCAKEVHSFRVRRIRLHEDPRRLGVHGEEGVDYRLDVGLVDLGGVLGDDRRVDRAKGGRRRDGRGPYGPGRPERLLAVTAAGQPQQGRHREYGEQRKATTHLSDRTRALPPCPEILRASGGRILHPLKGEAMASTEPHQPDEQSAAISAALYDLLGPPLGADDLVEEQSPNPRRPPIGSGVEEQQARLNPWAD